MSMLRNVLAASAALCFASGVAVAQTANDSSSMPPSSPPPAADQGSMPSDQAAPPPAPMPMNAPASGSNTSATVDATSVQTIASPPVPDTPANRAKYGQPMSRAGKHTAPVGN